MIPPQLNKKSATYKKARRIAKRDGWDPRWIKTESDVVAVLDFGCWFDPEEAERVVEFFPAFLRLWKGEHAGEPFHLMPWVADQLIRPLFGWRRLDEKGEEVRRFRMFYLEVPKKNSKSTVAGGLLTYLLIGDGEAGAEVYCAANDEEQATIVFENMVAFIESSPSLSKRCRVYRSPKKVVYPENRSVGKPLSREVMKHEGLDISGLIYDEIHAAPDRRLWDTLRFGGIARKQPLFGIITTAGESMSTVFWGQEHSYAERIIKGDVVDIGYLSIIYAADPEKDDWTSEKVWKRCNPSLGITLSLEEMRAACNRAKENPIEESSFKRYRLNWPCQTADKFMPVEVWKRCQWSEITEGRLTPADLVEALKGRPCYGGLDLSTNIDLTAFALCFPPTEGEPEAPEPEEPEENPQPSEIWQPSTLEECYVVLAWGWVPELTLLERVKSDNVPYNVWLKDGWIKTSPGNTIIPPFVTKHILEVRDTFEFSEIAYDPHKANDVTRELENEGVTMIDFPQTIQYISPAMREWDRVVRGRGIVHNGNPMLSWNVGNVVAYQNPNGDIRFDKNKCSEKIDAFVSMTMAFSRAWVNWHGTSVYERRGILIVGAD